jgi:hypothetical protein
MAIPFIKAALAVVAPVIKDVVMDVVKDVAMDVGKQFVDTISKGIKDVASEVLGKGAKVVGDLIKNPLDALKDLGKKLIPPGFQQLMDLGKTVMQAATHILQKFMEKIGINININVNIGGAQGAQASGSASGANSAQSTTSSNGTSSAGSAQSAGGAAASSGAESAQSAEGDGKVADMSGVLSAARSGNIDQMMKEYGKIPEKDRPMAMFAMQQELQKINQMMSMLTNIAQVQHDTSKAVINNLRV